MNKLTFLSALVLALISTPPYSLADSFSARNILNTTQTAPVILGYFSNRDIYNKNLGSAKPEIDFVFDSTQNLYKLARLNTVAYAFFEAASDGTIQSTDPWSDFDSTDAQFCASNPNICFKPDAKKSVEGGYGNFNKFAKSGSTSGITNRLIAFGGAGYDKQVEYAMDNPGNFVQSLKALKGAYAITGLDFDYEPKGGVPAAYIDKLINLMKAVRTEFGKDFMITYTIVPNQDAINAFGPKDAYGHPMVTSVIANWLEVVYTVDYINIMNYDSFGPWENSTGLQSGLYIVPNTGGSEKYSAEAAITSLYRNVVPLKKIILGYPSYARAVSGTANPGLGATFTSTYKGNLDAPACLLTTPKSEPKACGGMIAYSTIIANNYPMQDQVQNGVINGSYSNFPAEAGKGIGNAFVAFDSTLAVRAKVDYAKSKQLAGVMTWGINYDAPAVNADNSPNSASLLNAVNSAYQITPRPVTPPNPSTRLLFR